MKQNGDGACTPQVSDQSGQLSTRTALILYGSETGNANDVAEEVGRVTQQLRFEALVLPFDHVQLRDLLRFTVVIFVVSTTGQGEFPQNARSLWKALLSAVLKPGVLRRLRFTTFGLGDSSYPKYNVAHRMLHGRLLQLGAHTFCERGEGNEQHPEGHSAGVREWLSRVKTSLLVSWPLPDDLQPLPDHEFIEPRFKLGIDEQIPEVRTIGVQLDDETLPSTTLLPLKDSYTANIVSNQRLTTEKHFQDVRLFDLRLDKNFEYGPGAVAIVYPKNFPKDVEQFIDLMDWKSIADQPLKLIRALQSDASLHAPSPLHYLQVAETKLTMRWLLENVLDIMSIPRRSFFANLSHFASEVDEDHAYQKDRLLELANPELIDELWDYTTRPKRTVLEVMMDFTTIKVPWQYALSTLPIMRGRQFSIASGGELRQDQYGRTRVQLLVAIVDPPSPIIKWRRRYGVCTRYMASLKADEQINILMQPGYLDVQPSELSSPVVMIGPGTGVAPMRSMIYQRLQWSRQAVSASSAHDPTGDVLFFGCRSPSADYFFADEWQTVKDDIKLKVLPAFSRDAAHPKQYVQDLIRDNHQLVTDALVERNGKVYICGSSGNMPKGVRAALVEILASHAAIATEVDADHYLEMLEKNGRYKQETW